MQRVASSQSVPPAVTQTASTRNFGSFLKVYPAKQGDVVGSSIALVIGIVCALLMFWTLSIPGALPGSIILFLFALVFLIPSVTTIQKAANPQTLWSAYIYKGGLVLSKAGTTEAYRWNEMNAAVTQQTEYRRASTRQTVRTDFECQVVLKNGRNILLKNTELPGVRELAAFLKQSIAESKRLEIT